MANKNYEIIEHTADIGIRVFGQDLKSLFTNSAAAMFDCIVQEKKSPGDSQAKKIKIDLKTKNLEELFVRWLSELLSLADLKGLVFTDFKIHRLTSRELKATISGQAQHHFDFKREIKAVTYHDLKIEKQNQGYVAQVIFDV